MRNNQQSLIMKNEVNQVLRGKQHSDNDENEWLQNAKSLFFEALYTLLSQAEQFPEILFRIASYLQMLQLLYFLLKPSLKILDPKMFLLSPVQTILQWLNVSQLLAGKDILYLIVLAVSVVLLLMLISSAAYIANILQKKQVVYSNLAKIVSVCIILSCKILTLPILNLTAMLTNCTYYQLTASCQSYNLFVSAILSILCVLLLLPLNIFYAATFYIKYPFSKSWLAKTNSFDELFKLAYKLAIVIYGIVDSQLKFLILYLIGNVGINAAYLFFLRSEGYSHYVQKYEDAILIIEGFVFFQSLNLFLVYQFQNSTFYSFVLSLGCSILFGMAGVRIKQMRETMLIQSLTDLKKHHTERTALALLSSINDQKRKNPLILKIISKFVFNAGHNDNALLMAVVQQIMEESPTPLLKVMKCYLLSMGGNCARAIHSSIEAEAEKMNYTQEFMMYYFRRKNNLFKEEDRMFSLYYIANEESLFFEGVIEICARNLLEYWEEMTENEPSTRKILHLALKNKNYTKIMKKQYQILNELAAPCIQMTNIYLHFLLQISEDKEEIKQIRDKYLKEKEKQLNESKEVRLVQSQYDNVVITCDTIGDNIGIIINCNSEVKTVLNYERRNLLGKNITVIMPKFFIVDHNAHLTNFIQTKKNNNIVERYIFPISSECFFVEATLSLKLYSSTFNTLYFVGIIKKINESLNKNIILDCQSMRIECINRNFVKILDNKVSSKLFYEERVNISTIFTGKINSIQLNTVFQGQLQIPSQNTQNNEMGRQVTLTVKRIIQYGIKRMALISIDFIKPNEKNSIYKLESDKEVEKGEHILVQGDETQVLAKSPPNKEVELLIEASIKRNHRLHVSSILLLFSFAGLTTMCFYFYISTQSSFLTSARNLYSQLSISLQLLSIEGAINSEVARLYHNSTFPSELTQRVASAKQMLTNLLEATTQESFPLIINQDRMIEMKEITTQGTIAYNISYIDGLSQYLSSAAIPKPTYFTYSFIVVNGKQVLPKLMLETVSQYLLLWSQIQNDYFFTIYAVCGLYSLLCITLVCLVFVITWKVYIFHKVVKEVYSLIQIDDINLICQKCCNFLQKINRKHKMFKKQTGLLPHDESEPLKVKKQYINIGSVNPLIAQRKWMVFVIVFILFSFGFLFMMIQVYDNSKTYVLNLQSVGKIRKNLDFISFYAYEYSFAGDKQYLDLLHWQMEDFFHNTQSAYYLINDTLLEVYNKVEKINQIVSSEQDSLKESLSSSLSTTDWSVFGVQAASFQSDLDMQQFILIVKIVIEAITCFIFCLTLYCCSIIPNIQLSESKVNMLQVIPHSIIKQKRQSNHSTRHLL